MTRPESEPATLEQRLVRVEKRMRRLSALVVFLVLGVVLLVAWQLAPKGPLVQAQGFEVRDSHWQRRAVLGLREDGSPALRLNNADGRARAMLNVANDGSVFLRLTDSLGFNRLHVMLTPDGEPHVMLGGPDGRTLLLLEGGRDGHSALTLRDSTGRIVWFAAPR